ncbi:MAG: long-chain fatty acid--CoA ligase [Planctomycetes bacterium]|nr:long-chain fatty acid--CoA ligase [Planctomycetota bacterium]
MHSRSEWLQSIARHAAERPRAVAIAEISSEGDITRSATWSEFVALAEVRRITLVNGTPQGATVLAAMNSGIDLAAWFAACIHAGVRIVLAHPKCGAAEVAAVCDRACVNAAIAPEHLLSLVSPKVTRLATSPIATTDVGRPASPRTARDSQELVDPGSIVLSSSGTLGLPKLVIRGSGALDADARAVALGMRLRQDDCVLCIAPLCHSYGVDVLLGAFFAGATLRVLSEFDPFGAARQIESGVTVIPGVPFVYEALARFSQGPGPGRPNHGVRLALSAGSALKPRVRQEFASRWGTDIGQLYGATELGTVSLSIPGEPGFDPESIGNPLPGVSFRVVSADDPTQPLAPGQEGHLAVRSASMLSGYVEGEPELIDGHLLTGDLARLAPDGRATLTGRLKLLIDAGGFKVNPLEVEAALSEHPDVAECAVVALPVSDTIQRLCGLVVARDPQTPPTDSALRGFLKARLSPVKVPRVFQTVVSLPRSATGKLLRERLTRGGDSTCAGK